MENMLIVREKKTLVRKNKQNFKLNPQVNSHYLCPPCLFNELNWTHRLKY